MLSTKMVDFNFKNNPTFTRPLTGGATWSEGAFLRPLGGGVMCKNWENIFSRGRGSADVLGDRGRQSALEGGKINPVPMYEQHVNT